MSHSKSILQSAFLGFAFMSLAACQLPEPQKVSGLDDTASYFVSHTDGKFTSVTNHPNISLPLARTMSLTACVKESARSREILNHRFTIRGGPKEQKIITDPQGCLIWEEEMPFNYLADEKYVTIRRTLRPEGQQQGDRAVEFIINPWSAKIYSALDSRVKDAVSVEKATYSLQGTSQKERRSLWLDWVRLNVMQEKISGEQGSYIMEVSATLLMERLDERKERQLTPVSYGKVQGRVQLICAMSPDKKDPMRVVIAQMDNVKAEVVNGNKIFLNSRFTLKEFCPTTAYLLAGISVAVQDGPALLAPFQGLYHGGPVAGMVGPMFSVADGTFMDRFMKDKSYSIERYLADNKAIYRNGTKLLPGMTPGEPVLAGGGSARPLDPVTAPTGQSTPNAQNPDPATPDLLQKFRVEVRELQGMNYGFQQQSQKIRTLTYRVRACLRLGIDQQAIRAVTFNVHKVNGKTDRITTLDDGCLEFEDSMAYNHYANECWFDKSVRLENADYGFNETFKLQINPWSRGSQWFKDARWLPNNDRAARCANRPSQILLDAYFMEASGTRYTYSLDEQLNLNQTRQANITVRPQLYRATFDASTGYVTENLPAGRYLLRYALVDQSVQDFSNAGALKDRIYSVDRTLITVREDGQIIDQIRFTLPTESLMSLGLLNQFVIEIMPLREDVALLPTMKGRELENYVDYDHAIKTVPFVAAFIHRAEGGGLRKLENYIGKSLVLELERPFLRAQTEISASQVKVSKKEVIARLNGLDLVDLSRGDAATQFRKALGNSLPNLIVRREEQEPIAVEKLKRFMDSGKMDRELAVRMCGYIFRTLWTQKLPGKDFALLEAKDETDQENVLRSIQGDCVSLFVKDQAEAFDIEYLYLVKNPGLVGRESCARNENGEQQCATEVQPERVDPRSFSVGNSFSLSRSYGVHQGFQLEGQVELGISKYLGIGVGGGYGIGDSENLSQSNGVSFSQDMSLVMETLQFKVRAADAERCVMVRLNPMLFDREDPGFWLWNFTEKRSIYARSLNSQLSDRERWAARQKGIMICDGQMMGRPVNFTEFFYMVRPSTPVGLLGDEKSRATVDGLFTTMRGVNDMTAFMARVTYSDKIPASFQRELQVRQLDTSRLREAFLRGTRAMPGVYSTVRPLK